MTDQFKEIFWCAGQLIYGWRKCPFCGARHDPYQAHMQSTTTNTAWPRAALVEVGKETK